MIYKTTQIVFAVFCLVIGVDKFIGFLDPESCSLMGGTPYWIWILFGIVEIAVGISLLANQYIRLALGVSIGLFAMAILKHLVAGTYDIGGAVFLEVVAVGLFLTKGKLK